jgi:transposase
VAPSIINDWAKAQKASLLTDIGKSKRPLTDLDMELYRTKREMAEVKMERDILKNSNVLCKGKIYTASLFSENSNMYG